MGPKLPENISVSAFARHIGVDEAAVRKAVKTGRLERSVSRKANGRTVIVSLAAAQAEWETNRDPAKGGKSAPGSETARRGDFPTTADVRRRLLTAQARKAESQARKMSGQLVPAAGVRRETFEVMRTIRDNLQNIPDRVAHELAAEIDPAKIHARLETEIRQALNASAEALDA
jgi:phage terminase Nu1 subunit (DNA packaging protein)